MSALAAREDSRPRARARPVAVTAACVAAAILVAGCASTGASKRSYDDFFKEKRKMANRRKPLRQPPKVRAKPAA